MKVKLLLIVAAFISASCTQTFYIGKFPQSHFTYPNANVIPLTKVSGKSETKVKIFLPPSVTSSIMDQAYSDALRKASGADLMINVDAYHKVTQIPLWFINLYISRYLVDGTAAKQEVGKQKLSR
jgi:hypothetical protein